MAQSSKGVQICLSGPTATTTTFTAISAAKPAAVTATTTGINNNDVVFVSGTGMASLDNKYWVVANKSGTSFELLGSDATADVANTGTGKVETYPSGSFDCLCLSEFSISNSEPGVISTATFCDLTASVPSAVQEAGSVSMAGYIDITSPEYLALLTAADDAKRRVIRVTMPNQGVLVAPVTISSVGFDVPIDGALAWNATGVLGSKFQHRF